MLKRNLSLSLIILYFCTQIFANPLKGLGDLASVLANPSDTALKTVLKEKMLIGDEQAIRLASSFRVALKNFDGSLPSEKQLMSIINGLDTSKSGARSKKALLALLNKDVSELSEQELSAAHYALVHFSNTKGISLTVKTTCGGCEDELLANKGIKVLMSEAGNTDFLSKVSSPKLLAGSPGEMKRHIVTRFSEFAKDLDKGSKVSDSISTRVVSKDELKMMLYAVEMLHEGSGVQKELAEAFFAATKRGDTYEVFSASNPHKFHRLFSSPENLSDDEAKFWINTFNSASRINKDGSMTTADAVKKALDDMIENKVPADQRAYYKKLVKDLDDKNCFF